MDITTKGGLTTSIQCGNAGTISDLDTANFEMADKEHFFIKNDSDSDVELEVIYAQGSDFVATFFQPGWNSDAVRAIKSTQTTVRLLWGR